MQYHFAELTVWKLALPAFMIFPEGVFYFVMLDIDLQISVLIIIPNQMTIYFLFYKENILLQCSSKHLPYMLPKVLTIYVFF